MFCAMKLRAATKNANKLKEIRDKISNIPGLEIISPARDEDLPDVLEDGATFEENALKKAREVCRVTGTAALADDSGLEVDALGGEPGVYSARYAGENVTDPDRNSFLLEKMKDVPDDARNARFVCVIAVVFPDGREYAVRGTCEGSITREVRGGGGFGYDPVFLLPERGVTMAEIPLSEKNRISHRARALEKAAELLASIAEKEN
jgi:XTP/dITP diphosphohydrolase